MAQISNPILQSVEAGRNVVFTSSTFSPIERNFIIPFEELSAIILRGATPFRSFAGCGCCRDYFVEYYASFSANVQIPTGGTVEPISLAITVNGDPLPNSIMTVTPAAVEELDNISTQVLVPVLRGCCSNIAVENISTQAVEVQNANLTVFLPSILR